MSTPSTEIKQFGIEDLKEIRTKCQDLFNKLNTIPEMTGSWAFETRIGNLISACKSMEIAITESLEEFEEKIKP